LLGEPVQKKKEYERVILQQKEKAKKMLTLVIVFLHCHTGTLVNGKGFIEFINSIRFHCFQKALFVICTFQEGFLVSSTPVRTQLKVTLALFTSLPSS
jgi:hypothetical protein